ncbi:hypothetical protein [Campylobacter helveticus]|uniref:Uncharacterized protein n=2 Tax=Campylobacter helveticus TaxID=28898 RepID=A0AAX2UJD5_9BACT|nr:hypothetical protein [Campylobacter helveticus]ELU1350303.1 hypothetical protein [Campylobacter jejuni]MCR2040308.1 hypothetical protein [Campylobacter helveticus]MCR2055655.1 hypothetical protein [Campylobacter helveticus]MCR2060791.1 hypothetical protein [Campylobacter helveticus]MCR2065011.1 hypothetical protein [Campylobacter helveticus]
MFRTILTLSLLSIFAYAGVWSSMAQSGFSGAYNQLNNFVSNQNKEIEDFWNNEIKPLVEEINKESKAKEEKLAILRELEKAILLNEKEIEFLLHKENELLGNKANVIGQ